MEWFTTMAPQALDWQTVLDHGGGSAGLRSHGECLLAWSLIEKPCAPVISCAVVAVPLCCSVRVCPRSVAASFPTCRFLGFSVNRQVRKLAATTFWDRLLAAENP